MSVAQRIYINDRLSHTHYHRQLLSASTNKSSQVNRTAYLLQLVARTIGDTQAINHQLIEATRNFNFCQWQPRSTCNCYLLLLLSLLLLSFVANMQPYISRFLIPIYPHTNVQRIFIFEVSIQLRRDEHFFYGPFYIGPRMDMNNRINMELHYTRALPSLGDQSIRKWPQLMSAIIVIVAGSSRRKGVIYMVY